MNTDTQIGAGTSASDGSAAATTDSGTTASTSSDANFGLLMSSLNANVDTAAEVQAMTDVSDVNVVKVSDLAKGNNQVAVNNAISKNAEATTELADGHRGEQCPEGRAGPAVGGRFVDRRRRCRRRRSADCLRSVSGSKFRIAEGRRKPAFFLRAGNLAGRGGIVVR